MLKNIQEYITPLKTGGDPFEIIKKKTPENIDGVTVGNNIPTTSDDKAALTVPTSNAAIGYGTIVSRLFGLMETEELEYTKEADEMTYEDFDKFLNEKGKKDDMCKYYKSLDELVKEKEAEIVEAFLSKKDVENDVIERSTRTIEDVKKEEPLIFTKLDKCLDFIKTHPDNKIIKSYINGKL